MAKLVNQSINAELEKLEKSVAKERAKLHPQNLKFKPKLSWISKSSTLWNRPPNYNLQNSGPNLRLLAEVA